MQSRSLWYASSVDGESPASMRSHPRTSRTGWSKLDMIMLSDGQNHRYTGFFLDSGFTMSHGPIDGTIGPIAETG